MRAQSRLTAFFVVTLLTMTVLPGVDANPGVPYCPAASPAGATTATAAMVRPDLCEAATGRVFPEAHPHADYLTDSDYAQNWARGFVTDFIGYFEFQAGLQYIAAQNPDFIEVHEVAQSAGLAKADGSVDRFPIYMLEITNEKSPIPRENKLNMLFMLSIHGNEKGGREGGFRVLEDLVLDKGFATETVLNGAGISGEGLAKPTGGLVEDYRDYLDFMSIFLLFPNADGWAHDEFEYLQGNPVTGGGFCGTLFCRTNGNGVDMNRQLPTIGWQKDDRSHNAVGEPEPTGYLNWMVDQRDNHGLDWNYAIDIHGMLNHQNFGAIMLPAGSFTPQEMQRNLRLAETLKERFNGDQHFNEWRTLFGAAETAWAATPDLCSQVDCPAPFSQLAGDGSPTEAVGSTQFAEYYTVIDAIGYTDSGFSGDFFAQNTGLNAPGYDIELAYNHITVDSQYEAGSLFNDYHVHMVRHIVKSFMDAAAHDVQVSYEAAGAKTAYLVSQFVATNADDESMSPGGWADKNPGDDAWDYGADQIFTARPAKYWEDIQPFLCNNCGTDQATPGVLQPLNLKDLTPTVLARFDNLVIPGSAINQLIAGDATENNVAEGQVNTAAINAIMTWVENGGNLVLTDAGLKFFDLAGLTDGAVDKVTRYMGGIRMDLSHPLLDKVRGGVKQTYEPTPLGFAVGANAAPNWFIDAGAYNGLGGEVVGYQCGGPNLGEFCDDNGISLGTYAVGSGKIQFMGAILPDPTEEFYHPYGLDNYATTFSGNQIVRNMLGWDEKFTAPPVVIKDSGIVQSANEREATAANVDDGDTGAGAKDNGAPGLGFLALIGAIAAALVVRRRS